MKRTASNKIRALLAKLQALAARPGTPAEGKSAEGKIARLQKRYDFVSPIAQVDISKDDIFAGKFQPAVIASQIYDFSDDYTIANAVKWAIEQSTKINCVWRGGVLLAQAAPSTSTKLAGIAVTISFSFSKLWEEFLKCEGTNPADRGIFIMGLFDGCMNEVRPAMLPSRTAKPDKIKRAKRKAVAIAPGVALHPYTVAVGFGKQVRFSTPWSIIAAELEPHKAKEIQS